MGASSCDWDKKERELAPMGRSYGEPERRTDYLVTTSLPFMIPEWPGNEQKKL